MAKASPAMLQYFDDMDQEVIRAYNTAQQARKKGYDPEPKVDIPIARNMAERVEGLISAVAPELVGKGIPQRIIELEQKYGAGAWEVGLLIAEEVAKEKFCAFKDKRTAMEIGIRSGIAYVTSGIVSAPLEGFIELKIKKRRDGGEYFSAFYAGPIRGAGGTAASVSVIITDYVRIKMGYQPYDPTDEEIKRQITEITNYHERVTNLQYFPSEEELNFMLRHLPIEINGDPTEKFDVSNYKGLPRIETDKIRGGMCLVCAEGLSQKAAKLWKRLQKWGKDFGLEWEFLEEFLALQKRIKARSEKKDDTKPKITSNFTYIKDLVAGRPVLSFPMKPGGFRLRYGRTRTSGFSAAAIHPITQYLLNKYLATGTQLKVERPGKACSITVCDVLEGPIVMLNNGNVFQLTSINEVRENTNEIKEILFLGDILFNYGDFSENGHILVPSGYCEEWWALELEQGMKKKYGILDLGKAAAETGIEEEHLRSFLENYFFVKPMQDVALRLSTTFTVPLHPLFTYYWNTITTDDILDFLAFFVKAKIQGDTHVEKIIIPVEEKGKRVLELLGVPHIVSTNEFVVIEKHAVPLLASLGIAGEQTFTEGINRLTTIIAESPGKNPLEIINKVSLVPVRDKAGTFIGARMGRPEKAKMRKLTGSPHVLFPIGEEGGRMRSFQAAMDVGVITSEFPLYKCLSCDKDCVYSVCEVCDSPTMKLYFCKQCGPKEAPVCKQHGEIQSFQRRTIAITPHFNAALTKIKMKNHPELIKGVHGTSNKDHIPEHLTKGILRAKYNISVNKDGTTRYDMSELPITHFKPKEIRTPISKLIPLGYTHDIHGKPLEHDDQLVEIKPQDIILPASSSSLDELADDVLFRVANFIDDLLINLYGLQPYYNLKSKEDLIGHLVIGIAPHISAGMVGRIIGFSETQGMYCHPMFHAAMRRDCDGDEACVILLMDALLNFSRQFLPDRRGAKTMDSPLVLTTILVPSEVDDQALGVDVVWRYPLELYEAALQYKQPWEIPIEQIRQRLNTEKQYEQMGFTHPVMNINAGITCSAYKILPSMEEKLKGQMEIAEKVRAVNAMDVAKLVIEKHFLKDTRGNLRKFSTQQFRCLKCNAKFRRPPLVGKCIKCGGNLTFTVAEGSVVKYLEPSISLARKHNVPAYLQQVLEITKRRIESTFGKEREKQIGLGAWFG
ncbi:DNA polymerase II large subunit [Candidatus Woesearchaeota archaeon]|nr:DNA polymerase II large subunit [Candidatus Woesearchaeota archaeon]